jgi:putative ABC transport system permease protein
MIRHLFKLVWNRKRTNALIMVEILFSFLVVFALAAAGLELGARFRSPLGYRHEDVWSVSVDRGGAGYGRSWDADSAATFRRLADEVRTLPEVVAVASGDNAPFASSITISSWKMEGRELEAESAAVAQSYSDVLQLDLIQGRWFEEQDGALDWEPTVITARLATLAFGDEDPVGRVLMERDDETEGSKERRVVGVISEFRRGGDLAQPVPFFFRPAFEQRDDGAALDTLLIRLAPGTSADFEEPLLARLQGIAGTWTFAVKPLSVSRESMLRQILVPVTIIGLIAAFLLAMVVLGLIGVMWQNVTRRTREIGLRRATGARRSNIHRQIVAEVMITASLGVIVGGLLAIQVPLIGALSFLSFDIVLTAMLASAVFMLSLAGFCGLYPGWTATRVHPAEALHYE